MSVWKKNRVAAVTWPDPKSATDQSQANETDINVIVGKMGISGTVPGAPMEPIYGDWTQFPQDLREYIETARTIDSLREKLPEQLKNKKTEELIAMTPETLAELLKPADPPAQPETK